MIKALDEGAGSGAVAEEVERIGRRWVKKRGAVIMALHAIQGRYGHVSRPMALGLAKVMDVPMARIFEVLTFYNYFKLTPPGRFTHSVCTGTACHLKGGDSVLAAFEEQLGVRAGESTADGLFHLQGVRCLGCCGLAAVVTVNGKVHGKMSASRVPELLAGCRAQVEAEVES